MITVDYKGKTLAALAPGKKAILKCANMLMEDNVVITAPESTGGGGGLGLYKFNDTISHTGMKECEIGEINAVLETLDPITIYIYGPDGEGSVNIYPIFVYDSLIKQTYLYTVYLQQGIAEPIRVYYYDGEASTFFSYLNELGAFKLESVGEFSEWFYANTTPVGGECPGKHVIELEELPQNGLVEGEVYKVKKKALLSVAIYDEEGLYPDYLGLLIFILGPLFGIEDATLPEGVYRYSKEVPTDIPDFEFSFCYVESEEMLYMYDTDAGIWVSAAEAGAGDIADDSLPYKGAITSLDQMTEYGIYAYLGYKGSEFYEIESETYKLIAHMNGAPIDVSLLLPFTIEGVPTLPTEDIKESTDTSWYCYYAKDQQDVFIYREGEWTLFSVAMEMPFGGVIENIGQATDSEKFYVLSNNGGLVDYFHPEGTVKITESGNYDVTKISAAKVSIPDHAIYGKRRLTFRSIPQGLVVPVNFTTTFRGETVNCRAISFEYDFMDDGVNIDYVTTDGSSIRLYAEGLGEGYMSEGVNSYVDFGPEPQLVVKEFADYIMQGPALFEVVATPNITFTVDDVEYSAQPEIVWHEFCAQTEGFNSYMYWGGNPTKDDKYIYYNGERVESMSTIINGAAYYTTTTQ